MTTVTSLLLTPLTLPWCHKLQGVTLQSMSRSRDTMHCPVTVTCYMCHDNTWPIDHWPQQLVTDQMITMRRQRMWNMYVNFWNKLKLMNDDHVCKIQWSPSRNRKYFLIFLWMVGSALIHIERQVRGQLELLPFPGKKLYSSSIRDKLNLIGGKYLCIRRW